VARADEMPDLVGNRVVRNGALVMDHGECFISIGADPGGEPAAFGVVNDQDRNIRSVGLAQGVNTLHVLVVLIGHIPNMVEMAAALQVAGLKRMGEPKPNVADPLRRKEWRLRGEGHDPRSIS
jgi:hypothetical protein